MIDFNTRAAGPQKREMFRVGSRLIEKWVSERFYAVGVRRRERRMRQFAGVLIVKATPADACEMPESDPRLSSSKRHRSLATCANFSVGVAAGTVGVPAVRGPQSQHRPLSRLRYARLPAKRGINLED